MIQNEKETEKHKHVVLNNNSLSVNIENFGPIESAKINLKPLTIFAGSNNSGKSYASALIHSITPSQTMQIWIDALEKLVYDNTPNSGQKDIRGCIRELKSIIKQSKNQDVPENIINILVDACFKIIEQKLPAVIKRNFGSSAHERITIGQKASSIVMPNYNMVATIKNKKFVIKMPPKPKLQFEIYLGDMLRIKTRDDKNEKEIIAYPLRQKQNPDALARFAIMHICIHILKKFTSNTIRNSYYLPASRSGILQAHKTIISSAIRNISYIGIDDVSPKLSGIAADFMSTVIDADKPKDAYWEIASSLEAKLKGKIIRMTDPTSHSTEIIYKYRRKSIPMHKASSSVSELAPLILYMKYAVREGDLLILEEPEAHLDFNMQKTLARHIVKMIRAGLYVLITTHSYFIQEQISHCIMEEKTRTRLDNMRNQIDSQYDYFNGR